MKTITPKEIFKAGQILNLDVIPSLIGKTIAITSPEYSSNSVSVRTFKVLGLESEFEAAAKQPVEGYESRQEMWLKENNQSAIKWAKSRTVLIHEGDEPFARVADDNVCLDKGTFFGSDADREVYYLIVE